MVYKYRCAYCGEYMKAPILNNSEHKTTDLSTINICMECGGVAIIDKCESSLAEELKFYPPYSRIAIETIKSNYKNIPMIEDKTFVVVINGIRIEAYQFLTGHYLAPGDLYIARRNWDWKIAKCLEVHDNYVMSDPAMDVYSFDCVECFKVKNILGAVSNCNYRIEKGIIYADFA